METFTHETRNDSGNAFSSLLFNYKLEILASVTRRDKYVKPVSPGIEERKEKQHYPQ